MKWHIPWLSVKNNILYIIDTQQHIADFAKQYKSKPGKVISFCLLSKILLERQGIPCFYPDDLISLPNLNALGHKNSKDVRALCDLLDNRLQMEFIELRNMKIVHATFFTIKVFFDAIISTYQVISRLREEYPDSYFVTRKDMRAYKDLMLDTNGHTISLLTHVFPSERTIYTKHALQSAPRQNILKNIPLKAYRMIKKRLMSSYKNSRNKNIAVLMNSHDVPYVMHLLKDMYNFNDWDAGSSNWREEAQGPIDRSACSRMNMLFEQLSEEEEYRALFPEKESLFAYMHQCVYTYFSDVLGRMMGNRKAIIKRLSRENPVCLLTSHCRLDLANAFILEILRAESVPIVTYQEGGGAGYLDWPMYATDTALSDYFLVYGPGVKRSYQEQKVRAKIISVGSLRLQRLSARLDTKTIPPNSTVIYVVLDNLKKTTHQHYPNNGGFFSQAYRHQIAILETLKEFKNQKFVIKTLPGNESLYQQYEDDEHISIITSPLSEILRKADGFIVEYASTILLECVLTNKPIAMLYNTETMAFKKEGLENLRKRVYMTENPLKFKAMINQLIQATKNGETDARDTTFVENYCVVDHTEVNIKGLIASLGSDGSLTSRHPISETSINFKI